jgi:chemotaxis signal transduction protein
MITLREQVITVNNIQVMLSLAENELSDQKRIIVMEFANQAQGMLVGAVGEIIESDIEEVNVTDDENHIVRGTAEKNGDLFILVSVAELMKNED